VTIAEEAQRQLQYALARGIDDQATAMEVYESILANVTARVKFQTTEQSAFNEKVEEAAKALGLVVPAANSTTGSLAGVRAGTDVAADGFSGLTAEINKATEAQRQFTQATPGAPGPGGLFEVTLPDGSTALANLDGVQEGLRVAGTSGGGGSLAPSTRKVGLGFQGANTIEEMLDRGFKQLENGLFDTLVPLATGGIVTQPTAALVGEAGREAVIPLDQYNNMMRGGGGNGKVVNKFYITVQASNRTGGAQAGEEVVNALKTYNTNNGDFNRALTGIGS